MIKQVQHRLAQLISIAALQLLARLTMGWQVKGDHTAFGGQCRLVEQPVVQVATESMNQHQRNATLAQVEIAQQTPAYFNLLRTGPRGLCFGGTGNKPGVEMFDDRIDFCLGGLALYHNPQQCAHRQRLVTQRQHTAQHASERCLDAAGDLVGLHVQHFLTLLYPVAGLLEPDINTALGHR